MPDTDLDSTIAALEGQLAEVQGVIQEELAAQAPEPQFLEEQGVANDERGILNTLLENRPNAILGELNRRGYESTPDPSGRLGVRPLGSPADAPYRRIEPEGWMGGGSSVLGGIKELAKDVVLDGGNNILGAVPAIAMGAKSVLDKPLQALGLNIGTNVAGQVPTEMLTDYIAEQRFGVPGPEQTGDIGAPERGVALGALAGATQTGLQVPLEGAGALGSRFMAWKRGGTPQEIAASTIQNEVFTASPDEKLSVRWVDKATGQEVPPALAQQNPAAVEAVPYSPMQETFERLRDKEGFFNAVKQRARTDGTSYDGAARAVMEEELSSTGKMLDDTVTEIAKDPSTALPFSEYQKAFETAKANQHARFSSMHGDEPTGGIAAQVDQIYESRLATIQDGALSKLRSKQAVVAQQEKSITDELSKVSKEMNQLDAKASAGQKLSINQQSRRAELQSQFDKLDKDWTNVDAQMQNLKLLEKDPPVDFDYGNAVKKELYQEAKQTFDRDPGRLSVPSETYKNMAGALGDFMGTVAETGTNKELAMAFRTLSQKFGDFSDLYKWSDKALANMFTQLTPAEIFKKYKPGAALGKGGIHPWVSIREGASSTKRAFRDAIETLAPPQSTQQAISEMNAASAALYQTKRLSNRVVAQQLSRSVSGIDPESMRRQMALALAVDNGFVDSANAQEIDLNQFPPGLWDQLQAKADMSLQPLQDALKFGSEEEVGAAQSQIIKQYPDLFPPPQTGIPGEVVVNGKVKLYDPMDRARYAQQIQVDSGLDWSEKADIISEMNSTFTVKNPRRAR